ncbi:MAG TPA: hypothetical protein VNO17_00565 [Actinomycetota bacterium]|nr:hypothetical protein [Actinomycetota bacterium]
MATARAFGWASPLGVAVALFLAWGVLWVLIGVAIPIGVRAGWGSPMVVSSRSDAALLGAELEEIERREPALRTVRHVMADWLAGLLVAGGAFVIAVAWFGLRAGAWWAWWALTLVGLLVLPFWTLSLAPYVRAGAPLALGDLPPFVWVPAALLVPAAVAGFLGLR